MFTQNKKGYEECGQCQVNVLPDGPAYDFFRKWDRYHLQKLTDEQLDELHSDIKILKENYNYIIQEKETFQNDSQYYFSFKRCKEMSMLPLKKRKTEKNSNFKKYI